MVGESVAELAHISANAATFEGMLAIPVRTPGVVLFAHGSGSSRHSPRNTFVAQVLQRAGLGTLLIDLLSQEEDVFYEARFDIDLLAKRLMAATQWLRAQPPTKDLGICYFGASTGAAAALEAAATLGPGDQGYRIAWWAAGSGLGRPGACTGADVAHRRRAG